ncbi:MAG: hypothetical protein BWY17_04986 [Deltaproteobacteria bacterium ADurb.Bin207]|nr:MAG: hypothetical protein BWY17_04986 [Deltaproteobacteria bacterium ADurb.Bin207]
MPRAQHAQVEHQRLDGLVRMHGHARLVRQVERAQQVGDARAGAVQVAPGVVQRRGRVAGLDGGGVEVVGEAVAQRDEQVVVHGHGVRSGVCVFR